MSAFYDLASLVLVPSGYKASKVYAQKPLTTDGQLTFSRASTATRVNSAGLIETVSSNVPRLDYLNSSCPRLILEGQRTNLYTYSQEYDNAAWTKLNMNITANAANGPFGTLTADNAVPNTTNSGHYVSQSLAVTAGTTYTLSVYAKANGYDWIYLFASGSGSGQYQLFNVANGTLGLAAGTATSTITEAGDGWYRCAMTWTPSVTGNLNFQTAVLSSNAIASFAGDGTSGVLLYQSQLEAGAYPTSIIPTTTAAVTRLGDDLRKTGISSLIGQTEGVWYLDFTFINNGATYQAFMLSDGTSSNLVYMYRAGTSAFAFYVNAQSIGTFAGANNTRYKIAFAYKAGQHAVYINGTQVFTSTSSVAPTALSQLNADYLNTGVERLQSPIHQILLFKTRLTNAQLAELTAL